MEAIVSLAIIASAVTFVSMQISASNLRFQTQKDSVQREAALYDLFNELEHNASANNCITSLYLFQGSGCVVNLTAGYSEVYGLGEVRVAMSNSTTYSKNTTSRCLPLYLQEINLTREVCIAVGD